MLLNIINFSLFLIKLAVIFFMALIFVFIIFFTVLSIIDDVIAKINQKKGK